MGDSGTITHPPAGTFKVQEESLIQTAFVNEQVNTACKAIFLYKPEYINFEIIYYQINSKGERITVHKSKRSETIPPGKENKTATTICNVSIKPTEHRSASGAYYCQAKWANRESHGMGTFILFRDGGYTEPPLVMWICLITFTVVLAVVSIMGTVLLFWKREVVCLWKKKVEKCPAQGSEAASCSELPGSLYAALGPHEPEIYSVIEDKSSQKKNPAPKVSYQKTQEEIDDIVYENL
ncbi:NFAT activation molecule 1 isoform X2 [Sphaerodactylus townsendi]|uniref:NFAT activation molecule 1 isoform X2 n=1 Tax=Sphaerodactylus townsendi TaxID=933632 RepID=UPI0020270F8B|nr:NFAT activation molecule 1 isoform X2 [Sphaerodactylus townsendi]